MVHICVPCQKEFNSYEALEQHNKIVHGKTAHQSSKEKGKLVRNVIVGIVAIGLIYLLVTSLNPGKYDDFAKCITDKGAVFYGAFWCSHCKDQKEMFGSSAQYLPYVECSTPDGKGELETCRQAGITSYPSWKFSDGTQSNQLSLSELSVKTGCSLP